MASDVIKPLNIIILDRDIIEVKCILDQDNFTVYQNCLNDSFQPKVEDTALVISSQKLDMNCNKILNFFKNGGNVLCPVENIGIFNGIRGICHQKLPKGNQDKFWIKQSAHWISFDPKDVNVKDCLKIHFSTFCKQTASIGIDDSTHLTQATLYSKVEFLNSIQQTKILLDFDPKTPEQEATETYLPIYPYHLKETTFDFKAYQDKLKTKTLGQTVIHSRVVNSTFDFLGDFVSKFS